jgi:hypothetical protein
MGKPVVHWQLLSKEPAKLSSSTERPSTTRFGTLPNELPLG